MKKILLCLLLFSGSAVADEWTTGDTYREVAFIALHELDRRQTIILVRTKYELNTFLGDTPSEESINIYFASTALIHYAAAYYLPAKWRERFQNVTIGVAAANDLRNYLFVGVRIPLS